MIETNPYAFNPSLRGSRREHPAHAKRKGSLDAPPAYAPGCPVEEREAALEALDKMHRERPLRPPGR